MRAELARRLVAIFLAAAVSLILISIVLWYGPLWLTPTTTSSERLKAMHDVRSSLIQLLGGIGLLGGFVITVRTFALNRSGQITDRFSKAVEQLGGALDVRVGGIYALERIMRDSVEDHQPIVEILCAFVREHAKRPDDIPNVETDWTRGSVPNGVAPPAADVQAALTVLGRRPRRQEAIRPDLRRTDLRLAYLHGVDFSHFVLNDCLLDYSDMGEAKLSDARLRGALFRYTWLRAAILTDTTVRDADFSWAYLVDSQLPSREEFAKATLRATELLGAKFQH